MFDHDSLAPNVTSWLVYNSAAPKPQPQLIQAFYPWNDTDLVPVTPLPPVQYDTVFNITVNFTDINGINYAIINNNSYKSPDVPVIFTALTTGPNATNPAVYAPGVTNTFVLNHLDMIWLAVNNEDTGGHPCTPLLSPLFLVLIPW
jgi:iron transport multicopper oxidase